MEKPESGFFCLITAPANLTHTSACTCTQTHTIFKKDLCTLGARSGHLYSSLPLLNVSLCSHRSMRSEVGTEFPGTGAVVCCCVGAACKSSKSVSSLQFFSPSILGEVAFENWNLATDHISDLSLYSLPVMKNKCTASHREQRQVLSQGTWSLSVASEMGQWRAAL